MHRVFYSLLIAAFLLVSVPADSAIILTDGDGLVIGINGLSVGTRHYDVAFVEDSFTHIFTDTSTTPEFWGDISATDATPAAAAIVTVLNDGGALYPWLAGSGVGESQAFLIPTYFDSPDVKSLYTYKNAGGDGWIISHLYPRSYFPGVEQKYVVFSSDPIPIPGAVWLLGSGLIGIVGVRKKFKK